jgi:hypothetical protein
VGRICTPARNSVTTGGAPGARTPCPTPACRDEPPGVHRKSSARAGRSWRGADTVTRWQREEYAQQQGVGVLGFWHPRFKVAREVGGAAARPRVAKSPRSSCKEVTTESTLVGEDLQGPRLTYGAHAAVARTSARIGRGWTRHGGPTRQRTRAK